MKSKLLSIALLMGLPTLTLTATEPYTQNQSPKPDFKLITLPYSTDALAPVISQKTIELHHGKHLKGYVDQVNKLRIQEGFAASSLEEIVLKSKGALFNNAGQLLNHNLYFTQFSPKPKSIKPEGKLKKLIELQWGTFETFQKEFELLGGKLFGSGWLWLSITPDGKLEISLHQGGESPILKGNKLLLGIDLWEHAYYLDYNNRRSDHLKALWSIIDWSIVSERLQ